MPKSRPRPVWYWVYANRISRQLEYCRNCNRVAGHHGDKLYNGNDGHWLDFDHIVPSSKGGRLTFNNTTILCGYCNGALKGDEDWSDKLVSLAVEEANNPHRAYARAVYRAIGDYTHQGFFKVSEGFALNFVYFDKVTGQWPGD